MLLHNADCLDILPTLPAKSVDAVITDLPYEQTGLRWDSIIDLDRMWPGVWRVLKDSGVFITTASQPFTSILVSSQIKYFKHEWIWLKSHSSNFAVAKYAPLKKHESVLVFCRGKVPYYPQMTIGKSVKKRIGKKESTRKSIAIPSSVTSDLELVLSDTYYPVTPQFFRCVSRNKSIHPTQKPVELIEYLLKTYTLPGALVLDLAMGSGTTGVACGNFSRGFIGIERDEKYFQTASKRLHILPVT